MAVFVACLYGSADLNRECGFVVVSVMVIMLVMSALFIDVLHLGFAEDILFLLELEHFHVVVHIGSHPLDLDLQLHFLRLAGPVLSQIPQELL